MVKLTTPEGHPVYIRAACIDTVEEATGAWTNKGAKTLLEYGGQWRSVREEVAEVLRLLRSA